jgi:hypothetical protein
VASRIRFGKRWYLVRYKGFSEAFSEWISESDVSQVHVDSYRELLRLAEHDDDGVSAPASNVDSEPCSVGSECPPGLRRSTRHKAKSAPGRDVAD